jgi:hypothetical protein
MIKLPDYSEHRRYDHETCFNLTLKMGWLTKFIARHKDVKMVQDLPGAKE